MAVLGGDLQDCGDALGLLRHLVCEVGESGVEFRPLVQQPADAGFAFVGPVLPFLREVLPLVGDVIPLVGTAVACVGEAVAFVEGGLALDGHAVASFGTGLAVFREAVTGISGDVPLVRSTVTRIGRGVPLVAITLGVGSLRLMTFGSAAMGLRHDTIIARRRKGGVAGLA